MKWLLRRKLPSIFAATLLALSVAPAASAAPALPATPAPGGPIAISGTLLPMDSNNPFFSIETGSDHVFIATRKGNAFVLPSGLQFPEIFNAFVGIFVFGQLPNCSAYLQRPEVTGLCGPLAYQERVVRQVGGPNDQPTFNALSTQTFGALWTGPEKGSTLNPIPGMLIVAGRSVGSGSFAMSQVTSGDLVPLGPSDSSNQTCPPGTDVKLDSSPNCEHAINMTGSWTIAGNQGTGSLASLHGNGTIFWQPAQPPNFPFITYAGQVIP